MGVKKESQLDREYLMSIVSTLAPQHAYFQRGWNPILHKKREKPEKFFDNTNQLLTGLPKLGINTHGKANMVSKKPRLEETPEQKYYKLQKKREEMKAEMQRLVEENTAQVS